jgi:hypothetical protein
VVTVYILVAVVWCVVWFFEWNDRVAWNEPQEERTRAARMVLASPVWFVVVAVFLVKIAWLLVKESRGLLRDAGSNA